MSMELMKLVVFLDCSSEDTMQSAQSYSVLWTLRTGSESVLLDHIMIFILFTVILCFYKRLCSFAGGNETAAPQQSEYGRHVFQV